MRVALIRHGDYHQLPDVPSAWQPFALSEKGIAQAKDEAIRFAELLLAKGWVVGNQVYSSPLLRAWQTASIYIDVLADYFNQSLTHVETGKLSERCVGSVANMTVDEIERVIAADPRYQTPPKNWKSDSHYQLPFPGAESLWQAGMRVAEFIETQRQNHWSNANSNQIHLVIGHGAAIRHGACHLNVMEFCDVSKLSMFHAHPVVIQHLDGESGTGWQHIEGQWKVREKGSVAKD